MHTNRTIIVIPAFNEAASIASTIDSISSATDIPILVIDDASTDDTSVIARDHGATVLPLTSQLGAWGATQAGIRYTLKHGFDTTITIDADGQHDASEIAPLLQCHSREEADLTIGSCTSRGSKARHFAWQLFRTLSGLTVQDLTSGFRAYSRKSMKIVASADATSLDYQDIGVLFLLRQAGLKIVETDVCMFSRKDGKSRIFNSWLSVAKYMLYSIVLSLSHTTRASKS